MLIAPLNLVRLHRYWIYSINYIDEMVFIFLVRYHVKMPRELVTMQVASYSDKLSKLVRVRLLDEARGVLFPLFVKLSGNFVPLSWGNKFLLCKQLGSNLSRWGWFLFSKFKLRIMRCSLSNFGRLLIWLSTEAKEIYVLRLIHEVRLIALNYGHIFDCLLVRLRSSDHTFVEEGVVLVSCIDFLRLLYNSVLFSIT